METRSSDLKLFKSIKDAAREELIYIKGRMEGKYQSLLTPWTKFNIASMNGIEWGTITTIGGMSGSGKTAILNELETGLFERNPSQDFAVLSFNFEMLARRLVGRKISRTLGKTIKEIYSADIANPGLNITDAQYKQALEYCRTIVDLPVTYIDIPMTVERIREYILRFNQIPENQKKGILVTLDHSILVKRNGGKDQLETLYELGAMFSEVKKKIKVSFVIVTQLNRDIERSERKENKLLHYPQKSDVFGADALYQHSDIFLITHRPEMLGLQAYGPKDLPVRGTIYWHYIKCRDGDPIVARMVNKLKYNTVEDYIPG